MEGATSTHDSHSLLLSVDLDFDLILPELDSRLSPLAYAYLLRVIDLERERLRCQDLPDVNGDAKTTPTPKPSQKSLRRSQSRAPFPRTLSRLQVAVESAMASTSVPESGGGNFLVAGGPTAETPGGAGGDARAASSHCSQSVVCRKIISKVQDKKGQRSQRNPSPRQSNSLSMSKSRSIGEPEPDLSPSSNLSNYTSASLTVTPTETSTSFDVEVDTVAETRPGGRSVPPETPLTPITGKIVYPYTTTGGAGAGASGGARTVKTRTSRSVSGAPPPPACDFSQPVSNPLYRSYSPRGYVPSDDEVTRARLEAMVERFKGWIVRVGSSEHLSVGDTVQNDRILEAVTPEDLFWIIRGQLELEELERLDES